MASITIQDERTTITDIDEIREFLKPYGIWYEHWDVAGRISEDATGDEILAAYQPEIERLKEQGNFVTADVIRVSPETPGLDAMLAKFNKEHTHSEDEVRFTVRGNGVFHIHGEDGKVFGVHVQAGDLINVPRGTKHWFDLCGDRTIQCIRLFEDPSGWAPHYIDGSELHQKYTPVCFGPKFVTAGEPGLDPVEEL